MVGSILEKLAQACWKVRFAAHEEVEVDNGPARALRLLACAGLEEAAVDSTLETPVWRFQKQTSAEVVVGIAEVLLTKNAVAAEAAVERNHNPEPLQGQHDVPAAAPVADVHPGTVDLLAHPHRSGSHPAGLLVEGPGLHAAGSL